MFLALFYRPTNFHCIHLDVKVTYELRFYICTCIAIKKITEAAISKILKEKPYNPTAC
jgi:hypothetical protein